MCIPKTAEVLQESCFRGCSHLKTVTFEQDSRLVHIDKTCFKVSGIWDITIPASVAEIADDAISTRVKITRSLPNLGNEEEHCTAAGERKPEDQKWNGCSLTELLCTHSEQPHR